MSKEWKAHVPSLVAQRSKNPIRGIIESLKVPNIPGKPHIALSLGDPTVYGGNLPVCPVVVAAVEANLRSAQHNGYIHSAGTEAARQAVATYVGRPGAPLTADDVVIASGCSGALALAITVLANPGDSILISSPAFALYQTLAESQGIVVRHYNLLPERGWEADLEHMASLIDATTKAIIVNNPSNPCGSVYSEAHLRATLEVARKHCVPIIADEIYGNIVFESTGAKFFPLASLTDSVPILATGGTAKEYLVPGWRVGWVTVHDRNGVFADVRKALFALSQLLLGANSLVVSVLPAILTPKPGSKEAKAIEASHAETLHVLMTNAKFTAERVATIPGVTTNAPQGAMYTMLGFKPAEYLDIEDDVDFSQKLLAEENVLLLPGKAFNAQNFCRIVLCAPVKVLGEAFDRIEAFTRRHLKPEFVGQPIAPT